MNRKLKRFIIVCICLIVVGTCLASIGLWLGATGNINFRGISLNLRNLSEGKIDENRVSETIEINQPVDTIKTKIALGDIKVIESDEFKIVYTYDKDFGKPDIEISEGTLKIVDKFSNEDIDFKAKKWSSLKNDNGIEYKIYCPKDMKVKLIEMDNSLGEISISDIKTEALNINLDMGDIKLSNLKADTVDVDSSLGDLRSDNIQTNKFCVSASMGDIHIEGTLKGQTNIKDAMGDIKIKTSLQKNQYSLNLNTELGKIKVDGERIEGKYEVNNKYENRIDAETAAGDIKLEFN